MKILKIAVKTIAWGVIGAVVLFLLTGFVVLPLALPKVVQWQGTKLLGNPVSLGSASFNPLTLRLRLKNFKITDADNRELIGFGEFWIDVDARRLLKKHYRIETVGFDGLTVNAVLLPGNKLNLLSLVPKETPAEKKAAPPASTGKPQPVPDIVIDEIVLRNGNVTFADRCIGKGFVLRASAMNLKVTGVSTRPDCNVKTSFTADIDDKGKIAIEALVSPFVKPPHVEAAFSLDGYGLRALTPYVGKYTGRAVKDGGRLDLRLSYRIADNKLHAGHKVMVQDFNFAEKVESKDALPLPFGLAVALLKDPKGLIDISLPVKGDMSDPKFEYFPLLGQVAMNFVKKLALAPFNSLGMLVPGGDTKEMNVVQFAPGVSAVSDLQKQKLLRLAAAMKARPTLSLEINGGHDPETDWNAVKAKVFEEELAAQLKEPGATEPALCEKMYRARFGDDDFQALKARFVKDTITDEAGLTAEMKRMIIEKGAPDKETLTALAKARAQAVYETLIAAGLDASRVRCGPARTSVAVMNAVPTEFVMTVRE